MASAEVVADVQDDEAWLYGGNIAKHYTNVFVAPFACGEGCVQTRQKSKVRLRVTYSRDRRTKSTLSPATATLAVADTRV